MELEFYLRSTLVTPKFLLEMVRETGLIRWAAVRAIALIDVGWNTRNNILLGVTTTKFTNTKCWPMEPEKVKDEQTTPIINTTSTKKLVGFGNSLYAHGLSGCRAHTVIRGALNPSGINTVAHSI